MKKYLLGIVSGIVLMYVSFDFIHILTDNSFHNYYDPCVEKTKEKEFSDQCNKAYEKEHPIMNKLGDLVVLPGVGLFDPLTERCVPEGYVLKNGKKAKGRPWFNCNSLQIWISDRLYGVE